MTPQTYADLAHENMLLLTALWRNVWWEGNHGRTFHCGECEAYGPDKAIVQHQPGCALFGVDRTILAQLDAFDAMPEPV